MNWHKKKPEVTEFMENNYPPNFTYQDFGAQLTTEFFNASKFADIVINSGAKYVPQISFMKMCSFFDILLQVPCLYIKAS